MTSYEGSCLCGAMRYRFDAEPAAYGCCHCRSCRKASGGAFAANIAVPAASFRLLKGAEFLKRFESSPNKFRCFCSNCGSPLFAHVGESPSFLRVRLGSLDSEFSTPPVCHFFTGEKADWFEITDDRPEFPAWPSPDILALRGSRQDGS
ncbi:MAG: GFA family protein [Gammaproteobacteria bacterium]|nr:GFA family protein [Gammaproteobacteria bacterium]